ncbi:hypothetical protein PM082_017835 [Marasmius tenuissimus]|nr:hypothetical protein PM082_017835 [Marasmius tenuissimus]
MMVVLGQAIGPVNRGECSDLSSPSKLLPLLRPSFSLCCFVEKGLSRATLTQKKGNWTIWRTDNVDDCFLAQVVESGDIEACAGIIFSLETCEELFTLWSSSQHGQWRIGKEITV